MRVSVVNLSGLLIVLFALLSVSSCKPDAKQQAVPAEKKLTIADLVGDWNITAAYKEKSRSKMLEKGLFSFSTDNKFKTNILGDNAYYPFGFDGKRIKVSDKAKTSYVVTSLTSDTLVMTTKLRNFDFKFVTVKVK